jgi:asparagine synthase (glutamine-hydrolysing)
VTGQRPDGGAWRPPDARYAGPADEDSLGREIAGLLRSQFEAIAACFGSNVDAALSGGYDSRLVLAALLAVGVVPRLHVYGREEDADVRVAKRICEAEGWQLRHIDKSKTAPDLDGFADRVRANALAFEGFPPDGIFDSGADLDSRSERGAGGALMLNGGGGEIFRNFHYLADRPLSLREFIWSFYAQFDPRACTARFRGAEFERALGAAMKSELGIDREVLERVEIERLYPYFRCKYWMGRNNSVNNKLGFAATPFVTHALIERALRLPLRAKALGRFEARLIRELHPRLAAYPSAYGHSFAEPPTRRRALAERLSVLRPPWLRRYSFRLRHRRPTPRPAVLQDQFVGRLVDLGFPYLRRFFDVSRVYHHGQYNRLCTLEYLFETCHAADPIAP